MRSIRCTPGKYPIRATIARVTLLLLVAVATIVSYHLHALLRCVFRPVAILKPFLRRLLDGNGACVSKVMVVLVVVGGWFLGALASWRWWCHRERSRAWRGVDCYEADGVTRESFGARAQLTPFYSRHSTLRAIAHCHNERMFSCCVSCMLCYVYCAGHSGFACMP